MSYIMAYTWNHWRMIQCQTSNYFAIDEKMKFRGHNLIWASPESAITSNTMPPYVANETNITKVEDFAMEYIDITMKNMGNHTYAWSVVSEVISDRPLKTYKDTVFMKIDDFICKAFQAARKAGQGNKLFYSDRDHLSTFGRHGLKSDKVFKMVKQFQHCGIDGVGFASHLDYEFSDKEISGVKKNMARYHELGLDVEITELDVSCPRWLNTN